MLSAAAEFNVRPFWKILPDTSMRSDSPQVLQAQSDLLAYFILAGLKSACFYVSSSVSLLLFTFSNDLLHSTLAKQVISKYFVLIFVILRVARNSRFFFFFCGIHLTCLSLSLCFPADDLMNSVLARWCSFFQENTQKWTKKWSK